MLRAAWSTSRYIFAGTFLFIAARPIIKRACASNKALVMTLVTHAECYSMRDAPARFALEKKTTREEEKERKGERVTWTGGRRGREGKHDISRRISFMKVEPRARERWRRAAIDAVADSRGYDRKRRMRRSGSILQEETLRR